MNPFLSFAASVSGHPMCFSLLSTAEKIKEKVALKLLIRSSLRFFVLLFCCIIMKISYLIHTTAIGSFFISVFYIFIHICTYVSVCFSTCFFPFFNSVCICTIVHGSKYMQYCIVVLTSLSLSDSNANKGRVTSMSCQSYLIHPVKNSVGHSEPYWQCTVVQCSMQQAVAYLLVTGTLQASEVIAYLEFKNNFFKINLEASLMVAQCYPCQEIWEAESYTRMTLL